jgi:signal transduction histidine kinase
VAALIALGAAGFAVDRWFTDDQLTEVRDQASLSLYGHAAALEQAVTMRAVVLDGLAAWIRERPDAPPEAFRRFASSLSELRPGIRALQRVDRGRIVDTYPLEGNEGALGLELLSHSDTSVSSGLVRALESGGTTTTAPVQLVQGGVGVILRRSTGEAGDYTAPAAAVVVDVDTLMAESGLHSLAGELRIGVATAAGDLLHGEAIPSGADPIVVEIEVPDGVWILTAAPPGGWRARVAGSLLQERLALATLWILTGLLVYAVVDRDTRLAHAVAARTAELTAANERLEAAAAELSAREHLLQAALDAGRVATWSWDLRTDRLWRWGSGQGFYRVGVDAPTHAAQLPDRAHPEDRETFRQVLAEARVTGVMGFEYRMDMGDGEYHWMRTQGEASESDEKGRPVRIVGAVADISKVKKLEVEVLHRGRLELIGQLAGGMVHDLKNVLTVVQGELEMALDEEGEPGLREAAGEALAATRYASLLLGQVLTFARKDEVHPTTFEWDAMCREAASFLGRLLGRTVILELDLGAPDAHITMDRAQAMQVLANLSTNARDAMGGAGKLSIATRTVPDGSGVAPCAPAGPCVVLEVRDTGPGIAAHVRERIFEPFFTTKGEGSGTGLGLSTTQRVARENGGDITFHTSDGGSTFLVVLPLGNL